MSQARMVAQQEEWGKVLQDLDAENLKLAYYDDTMVSLLGDVTGKKILDYGAGPGVLALALQKLGADVKVWDLVPDMRQKAADKIGADNVYESVEAIPRDYFDALICNLVVCIVPEDEVRRIVKNIHDEINENGRAYIGFCNPHIFEVKESNLDLRFPTGEPYEKNHDYKKVKKEGGYEIIESHRPDEWYEQVYDEAGLELVDKHYTPEYELNGIKIKDFVIFELKRK